MGSKPVISQELKNFKKKLEKKIGKITMVLFGSNATGKATPDSDVDLIIVSPSFSGKKFYERSRGFWLAWEIDKPVDFICLTPEEFEEKSRQASIVSEALKHGITI